MVMTYQLADLHLTKFSRVELAASSTRKKVVRFPDTNFSSDSLTAGHWQVGGLVVGVFVEGPAFDHTPISKVRDGTVMV